MLFILTDFGENTYFCISKHSFNQISEEMPIHIEIEKDALYLRGNEKGIEKGIEQEAARKDYIFVSNLLLETEYDDAKIARLADVTLDFVQKVKEERPDFLSVSHFLLDSKLKNEKIALLANVSVDFVKKVRLILVQKK